MMWNAVDALLLLLLLYIFFSILFVVFFAKAFNILILV